MNLVGNFYLNMQKSGSFFAKFRTALRKNLVTLVSKLNRKVKIFKNLTKELRRQSKNRTIIWIIRLFMCRFNFASIFHADMQVKDV